MQGQESVPSVLESEARGEIADIYADIRKVLGTSVVNLIWRNLATMPGALEWTWSTVRPLYLGDAPLHAEAVRQTIALPDWPGFSTDTLAAAGVDETERALIRDVLDSYQYTNALALVVLSALLAHYEPRPADAVTACRHRAKAVRRQDSGVAPDGCVGPGGGSAGRGIEFLRRRHRAAVDREHVPASGVLAGLPGAGANHAGAAAAGRAAECADAFELARLGMPMALFSRRN